MKKKSVSEQSFLTVYFCGKEKCQPGHYFGPAVRPHYLIHVILEGKGIFQKSGVTYSLKKGDKIVTTGGIYGKVQEIGDYYIIMEVEGQNHLKVDKSAVIKDMTDAVPAK